MAGPVSEILLGAFRYGTQLLGESLGYLGRTGQDVVSGVRLIRLRQARARSPERAAEYDPQIELLREQQAARWAQWRTLPDGRRWAIRSASLLLTVGTVWASPYLVPGLGGTSRPLSQDVLILRSDETRTGELQTCVATTCTLDSTSVPRDAIAWIGLRGAEPDPPAVNDPAQDEVHLRDRTVHSGALVGISAGEVLTERRAFERPSVAWTHLALREPEADADSLGADEAEGPEEPPEKPPEEQEETKDGEEVARASPEMPPGPREHPVAPCPDDKPLGGWILEDVVSYENNCVITHRGLLWFPLVPAGPQPWPEILAKRGFRAAEIHYEIAEWGCSPTKGRESGEDICRWPASRYSGTANQVGESKILRFEPLYPSLLFLSLPKEILVGRTVSVTCEGLQNNEWKEYGYKIRPYFVGGTVNPIGICVSPPSGSGNQFCVPATACVGAPIPLDCLKRPDHYAVIPFSGHLTWQETDESIINTGQYNQSIDLQWAVCCGCGRRPPGAPPDFEPPPERRPPKKDPCGDEAKLHAPMDLLQDQRNALSKELDELWQRFEQHQKAMEAHRDDFELTMRSCNLWNTAMKLMEYLIKGGSGPGKALIRVKTILAKIRSGNPTWAIPDIEGDPVSNKALNETWKYLMEQLKQSRESDLQTMQRKLEKCAGSTPMTSYETYKGAQDFIDSFGKMAALLPEIQAKLDQVYKKDLDLWNEWQKYYRDCQEWAKCKELDPSVCDPAPPERAPQ